MAAKRIALFVEGEGDRQAVPVLIRRICDDCQLWDRVQLDPRPPFNVGNVADLVRNEYRGWQRVLEAARRTRQIEGILVVLDGDVQKIQSSPSGPARPFCAKDCGQALSGVARHVGAGTLFG